jgi:hypothetical protein
MHAKLFTKIAAIITHFGVIGNNVTVVFVEIASIGYSLHRYEDLLHHSCRLSQPTSLPNPLTLAGALTAGSCSRAPCGTPARA